MAFFPTFIAWTGMGIAWYSDEVENQPKHEALCLDEGLTWIILFWIFLSAFVVIMYFLTLFALLLSVLYDRQSDVFVDQRTIAARRRMQDGFRRPPR